MNIFKRRISLILSAVILATAILPIIVVNAASTIDYSIKMEGKTVTAGKTYNVEGGEEIIFSADVDGGSITMIAYQLGKNAETKYANNKDKIGLIVPEGKVGTTDTISLYVVGADADGNRVDSGWKQFGIKYVAPVDTTNSDEIEYNLILNHKTISFDKTYEVEGGEEIIFETSIDGGSITMIGYQLGKNAETKYANYRERIGLVVPDGKVGTTDTIYLYVVAEDANGNRIDSGWKTFKVKYVEPVEPEVTMTIKLGTKTLNHRDVIEVEGGEVIKVNAKSSTTGIEKIGYYYATEDGKSTDIVSTFDKESIEITLPKEAPGTVKFLFIEAVAKNDEGDPNTVTKTGWKQIQLEYPEEEVTEPAAKDITVAHAGKTLVENSTTTANPNESLKITATPADKVVRLYFKWDNDAWSTVPNTSSYSTRIPDFEPGSTHTLYVKAEYEDGTMLAQKKYIFKIPAEASSITMNVKLDSSTITPGKTYEVVGGEQVVVNASVKNTEVDYIKYYFGNDDAEKVNKATAKFEVPNKKAGTTLKMYIEAVAEDGSTTGVKVYTLKFVDAKDGELNIEPWMEENDEIAELSINLRNDSEEEEKANKNIYALEETVTYFVDYKNGTGEDIDSKVTIVFDIPLNYDVIDADEGDVDEDEDTITWVFEDGLEEDEAGTKVVKLKYTGFTKSKYEYERIYPTAGIFKGKKEMDRSTVINLIIEEYDMEIDELHEPYMFGDEETPTFRPDDTITRAEGALVLARIYGLNYKSEKVTDVFSDLDETYLEAQKAIVAASKAGLINGYTNGKFKPNESMTRAEFIKILACMVEETAADEDIEGLEIKDVENNIKVYADSTRYYIVDGKKIYSHWALEEVTLLARLNMLPVTADEPEIELDEEISRAEVAQLVNFYLLRAPASVNSKTKSGFDDVTKKHDLFADIIEATRDDHTFSMNEDDGTENAE